MAERRLRLWRLCAVLLLGAALWGLGAERDTYYDGPPPLLEAGLARTRLDGGQRLGLARGRQPNELSRLNLGTLVDFKTARPDLLGRLPGLGWPTIRSGRQRGYLLDYQSRRALGLLMNYEKMDTGDESRSSFDDL